MTSTAFLRRRKGASGSFPQIFFLQFSKTLFVMIEYRIKEFCNFYEIERKSVVGGVEYWLPVDIYCGLFVVSEYIGIYGSPKMPIFNSFADAVNVINSIKDGIKYHYFKV